MVTFCVKTIFPHKVVATVAWHLRLYMKSLSATTLKQKYLLVVVVSVDLCENTVETCKPIFVTNNDYSKTVK